MSSIINRIFLVRTILSPLLLLFPTIVFACSMVFQEIVPGELKARLLLIAPNKKEEIESLDIDTSIPYTLSFSSKTGISFKITKDSSLKEPEIELSSSSKILRVPSYEGWERGTFDNYLKSWLIGHEIHPYTSPSKTIQYTEAQNTTFVSFKQTLIEGVKSFLHISPTSTGKTLVMVRALKEKLQNHRTGKISFVTAHQIHLVDQLFEAVETGLKGMDVTVINWNNRLNKDFYVEIERSLGRTGLTVLVITTQSLKSQLGLLQREKEKDYNRLVENTDGIYIDEAHHLGAVHTKSALLRLQERSGAFLYGTTATPVHHEVNLRGFFEREHWSYFSSTKEGDLFASHPAEKVLEQLSTAIERGEITPFDALYVVAENNFNIAREQPLFVQPVNHLRVLNPHHYNRLVGILNPILSSNKKGFIVTATIAEAKRLTEFLSEVVEEITFEAYHSKMTRKQRQEVLRNSKEASSHYIVAVRALDEGVNLPHLSAYIDLNVNVSVKQMVHRIGRVLRLHPGKTGADILFLADYRNEEMARDLLSLLDIVDMLNFHRGVKYRDISGDISLRGPEIIPLTREELQELREALRESVRGFWSNKKKEKPTYEELIEILIRKNIFSGTEWEKQRAIDRDLQHIPKNLSVNYKEWTSHGGWEYVNRRAGRKYARQSSRYAQAQTGRKKPSYTELIEILIRKNIFSGTEWEKQRAIDRDLQHIPKNLSIVYEEWTPHGGWGYVNRQAGREYAYRSSRYVQAQTGRKKPSFEKLIGILISKNILSHPEWKIQRENDPDLQHIPRILNRSYKEWTQNGGWEYVNRQAGKKYARQSTQYVQAQTGRDKPSYEELVEILIQKNIFFGTEWEQQRDSDPDLKYIPKILSKAYKEWTPHGGWGYVRRQAGKHKPSFEELIEILIRKNVLSGSEWKEQRENDPDLQHIPRILNQSYKEWTQNGGWEYVNQRAGKEYVRQRSQYAQARTGRNKPTYEELIEILIRENIFSGTEWEKRRENDPDLHYIPKGLSQGYKEWAQNGGWRYVREQAANKGKSSNDETIEN